MKTFYTLSEAERELNCSERWFRKTGQGGKIPKVRRDLNGWRVYAQEHTEKIERLLAGVKN